MKTSLYPSLEKEIEILDHVKSSNEQKNEIVDFEDFDAEIEIDKKMNNKRFKIIKLMNEILKIVETNDDFKAFIKMDEPEKVLIK